MEVEYIKYLTQSEPEVVEDPTYIFGNNIRKKMFKYSNCPRWRAKDALEISSS